MKQCEQNENADMSSITLGSLSPFRIENKLTLTLYNISKILYTNRLTDTPETLITTFHLKSPHAFERSVIFIYFIENLIA